MLPFRVDRIEQHRTPQKNAARPYLPQFPLATKLPSERKLAKSNRQIPPRLSGRLSRRYFVNASPQNMGCLTRKIETVLAKWAPTSNRQWSTNRSYRKQTTKPCLTGTRTHNRPLLNLKKIARGFAALESQNTELPLRKLWNPLWNPLKKTKRFLQTAHRLLPGSDQNIENDVTQRKQRTQKFLPGATTTHSRLPKFREIAPGSGPISPAREAAATCWNLLRILLHQRHRAGDVSLRDAILPGKLVSFPQRPYEPQHQRSPRQQVTEAAPQKLTSIGRRPVQTHRRKTQQLHPGSSLRASSEERKI